MTRSEIAIPRTLKHEGGYVDHPRDPGGATNKGITIATFRRYIKPNGTKADLKALTTNQAVVVYKRQYWDAVSADLLPHGVDFCVFDYGVNSGPSRAAKALQGIVGVTADGKIGPVTIAAVRKLSAEAVIEKLCDQRMAFLRRLKAWPTFGRGWTRRVDEVRRDSLSDARTAREVVSEPVIPNVDTPAKPQGGLAWLTALLAGLFGRKGR